MSSLLRMESDRNYSAVTDCNFSIACEVIPAHVIIVPKDVIL